MRQNVYCLPIFRCVPPRWRYSTPLFSSSCWSTCSSGGPPPGRSGSSWCTTGACSTSRWCLRLRYLCLVCSRGLLWLWNIRESSVETLTSRQTSTSSPSCLWSSAPAASSRRCPCWRSAPSPTSPRYSRWYRWPSLYLDMDSSLIAAKFSEFSK